MQIENPHTAKEMPVLVQNLDMFDFVPNIHSPKEYMIRNSGSFKVEDNLASFIDYEPYGWTQVEHEADVFNDQGYVAYKGTQSLTELMMKGPDERQQVRREMQMGDLSK